jgi:KipI family sensor histidine kinase inhibitor
MNGEQGDRRTGAARIRAFGETAVMVDLGAGDDDASNALAQAFAAAIRDDAGVGWGDPVPAYDSVLVPFDPDRLDLEQVGARLRRLLAASEEIPPAAGPARVHRLRVRYGGVDGPDLEAVAARLGLTPAAVVEAHAAATYRVFMLGFAPGFAYLGPLPEQLRLPRRDQPRARVPVGSVAIADARTAVYPGQTAGGWHLIGLTDTVIWDARRREPALFAPGDAVRFEPILD